MTASILVTRPTVPSDSLVDALTARGYRPIRIPTVAIDDGGAAAALDAMLGSLASAEWLVITSANGARAVARRLATSGARLPSGLRVATVGPATAEALRSAGIRVDHVPATYLTAAIADGLGPVEDRRIVLARAEEASPALRRALVARGAIVDEVVAYRTVEGPAPARAELPAALRSVAGIAFTSGSTVRGLDRLADAQPERDLSRAIPAFCIGPVTANEARRTGFAVTAVAAVHTGHGLAEAIHDHFTREDQ